MRLGRLSPEDGLAVNNPGTGRMEARGCGNRIAGRPVSPASRLCAGRSGLVDSSLRSPPARRRCPGRTTNDDLIESTNARQRKVTHNCGHPGRAVRVTVLYLAGRNLDEYRRANIGIRRSVLLHFPTIGWPPPRRSRQRG